MPEDMGIEQAGLVDSGNRIPSEVPRFTPETQAYLGQHFRPPTLARKIDGLTTAGFKDPVASIEKHPPLASYDIKRVKRRLRLIQRLNRQFNLDYDPIGVIEAFPQYLGYSKDRLFFFLRIASFYSLPEPVYRGLTYLNPFLVFRELLRGTDNLKQVRANIRKLTREGKADGVEEIKATLPEIENILKTYSYSDSLNDLLIRLSKNLQRQSSKNQQRSTR